MVEKDTDKKKHFETGIKLSAQGKIEKAMIAFEQVLETDPNYRQSQLNLKWLRFKLKDVVKEQATGKIKTSKRQTLSKNLFRK